MQVKYVTSVYEERVKGDESYTFEMFRMHDMIPTDVLRAAAEHWYRHSGDARRGAWPRTFTVNYENKTYSATVNIEFTPRYDVCSVVEEV